MSVKINNMSGTIFASTPSGVTKPVGDNTTYAATTAFVKSLIGICINLTATITLFGSYTFGTVYTNILRGISNLVLAGNVSIGGTTTTLKILNNTIELYTSQDSKVHNNEDVISKISSENEKNC